MLTCLQLLASRQLVTIQFDADGDEEAIRAISAGSLGKLTERAPKVSVYRNYFARQNRLPSGDKSLPDPPKYLAIAEIQGQVSKALDSDAKVEPFSLLKGFGDSKATYFL